MCEPISHKVICIKHTCFFCSSCQFQSGIFRRGFHISALKEQCTWNRRIKCLKASTLQSFFKTSLVSTKSQLDMENCNDGLLPHYKDVVVSSSLGFDEIKLDLFFFLLLSLSFFPYSILKENQLTVKGTSINTVNESVFILYRTDRL